MGDTLKGKEISGTPQETRGATTDMAKLLQQYLKGGSGSGLPFQRMQTDAIMNLIGFNPGSVGLGDALTSSLADPAKATSGLFASLKPFEEEATARAVAANKEAFGNLGGRFSSNLLSGQAKTLRDLNMGFEKTRADALLTANGQRNDAIQNLLSGLIGAGNVGAQGAGQLMNFLSPGTPAYQPGILGDLIGAGGNAAALAFMG